MEALSADALPRGDRWQFEPKWDGFRCLAFRDGKEVVLESKASKPLTRYFPEVVAAVAALPARRFVIDGEIVVSIGETLSFDDLLQRIHPAESRIHKLAKQTPATLVVFDLLVDDRGRSLVELPLSERRERLEAFAGSQFSTNDRIRLSPMTYDLTLARRWFGSVGKGGLDGVIAKRRDAAYESGLRSGAMQKIKKMRTADCVVGGFRYASKGEVVGSLLLGLYDEEGKLNHVGFTSTIKATERGDLTRKLRSLIAPPGFTGAAPGGPSRWSTERSSEWQPLSPTLVCEVQYDHFSGGRFRHGTKFLRWRPDKDPRQCTMKQVQREAKSPLLLL